MRFVFLTLTFLFAIGTGIASAGETVGKTIEFQISDRLAGDQIDEQITVSINHLPVGTLKVDADKSSDTLTITVPAADTYVYDLCGQLIQHEGAITATHKIDSEGRFNDLGGRRLVAYNIEAAIFYLVDNTPDKTAVEGQLVRGAHGCSNTVATNETDGSVQLR